MGFKGTSNNISVLSWWSVISEILATCLGESWSHHLCM
jgi:hypothetical protein